ncbi:zinc-finger double domain-containing protein [Ditylenchus destructor]|uniref:Protein hunchback n=1 Tax=Ditylenchus destructor TaxID=166010 RepID=A0AAD4N3B3_9BILA|nr:zinc-finger double domain-containing protein [Ditylenchus destructor]
MPSRAGEKPFKCNLCSYASNQKGNLLVHMQRHTGERPFKCDHFTYAATTKDTLQVHLRSHTGEKPYKCDHCSFASVTQGRLTVHERKHTGEKPYKCDHCSFATVTQSGLTLHLRTHTRVVPSHCSSSFESSGKEGAHTTSQSASEGRRKEEERDAYDPARAPTQLADTHASLSSSFVRPSLIDWLVVCAPSFPLDSKLELR